MQLNRTLRQKLKNPDKIIILKNQELANGPSKLCMALQIGKEHCKYSMSTWKGMWIENDEDKLTEPIKIIKCPRIGIDRAGPEWANKPMRYYIYGNSSVSKRDQKAEDTIINKV